MEIDDFGPVTIRASHIADQLVVFVPENRSEFEEDFVENAHAGFADGLAFASGQARVKGDSPGLQDAKGHGDEYAMSMVATMVGQDVNECARVIDLLHFVPKEDSGVRG